MISTLPFASHRLLPGMCLLLLMITCFVTEGNFLFLFSAEQFAVSAIVFCCTVDYWNSGLIAFQSVAELYHIAHKTAPMIASIADQRSRLPQGMYGLRNRGR